MSAFSGWVYTVSVAAVLCSLAAFLTPSAEFAEYIKLACVLAFIISAAKPAVAMLKTLPEALNFGETVIKENASEYNLLGNEYTEDLAVSNLENQLNNLIAEKTGVKNFVGVYEFSFTEGGITDGVSITLKPGNGASRTVLKIKKSALEKYISGLLVCEVKITVE